MGVGIEQLFDYLFEIDHKEIVVEEMRENDDRRTEKIQLRLSTKEKKILEELATIQHLDVSNFLRWLVFKKYTDELVK